MHGEETNENEEKSLLVSKNQKNPTTAISPPISYTTFLIS